MLAEEFAALVIDGLPGSIAPFVEVKASPLAGGVVLDFSYTYSTAPLDRMNARHIFMMVTGWRRDPDPDFVYASTTTRTKDAPLFRKSNGEPAKVAKAIVDYFKKNQAALLAHEPYVSPATRSGNPSHSEYTEDELAAAYAILCQYGASVYDDEVYEIEEWISAIGLDVEEVYAAYMELVAAGYHGCGRKSANPARSKKTTRSKKKTTEVPTEAPTDIEYVIWGIPPGEEHQNVLHTRSKSMAEAQKIIKILETEHGCAKCHVQVLDLTKPPDFSGVLNNNPARSNPEMTESEFGDYFRKDILRAVVSNEEHYGPINLQARRQAWDDVVAALIRERKFAERRSLPESASSWPYPEWLGTVRFVRRTGAESKRKKSDNPSDLTWYENDDGSWDGEFWSMRVAKVSYAEAGEVEGGLGALARYMTASWGGAQAGLSPEGWYWQATEQQGVWSRPRLAPSAAAAKRAAEKALRGYFEKKRAGNPSVQMKRMMNPQNY